MWNNQTTGITSFAASAAEIITTLSIGSRQFVNLSANDDKQQTDRDNSNGCTEISQGDFIPWNNPNNLITEKTEFWIEMVISAGAIPVLWLVGLVGNVLSGMVFYRQGLRNRINLCLFCLALADQASVTVIFLMYAEGVYRKLVGPAYFFLTYFVGLTGFSWVSQFLSTVIASERCFCVVSPLKAKRLLSTRKMAMFIGVSSVVLLGGMLVIAGHKHRVACINDPLTNHTKDIISVTSYYLENKAILDIFDVLVYSTVFPAIFLLIITITSVVTAYKLKSALLWRQKIICPSFSTEASESTESAETGDSERCRRSVAMPVAMPLKEAALTRMLLASSLFFLLCTTPNLMLQLATFVVTDLSYTGHYYNLSLVLWAIVSLSRALNSSLNFFIYYVMGSRFKKTLKEILPHMLCKKTLCAKSCSKCHGSNT